MKRKAIEKIEPAKTRKKGHIATVQTLDDIAIINVFNDKVLAARYWRTRILDRKEWLEERKTHNSNRRKLVRMGMDET